MSCSRARKITAARITKINSRAAASTATLEHYCQDLNGWPRSWLGLEKDVPPGEQLVACFRPLLEFLAPSELSPTTIQKHVDNTWGLGRRVHPRSECQPGFEKEACGSGPVRTDRVTRSTRDTAFKRVLKAMLPGSALKIEGPSGSLTLHDDVTRTAVFLAGGIGITPFRSIVRRAAKEKLTHRIVLFYSNRRDRK